jgi:hypothetical protein
MADHQDRDKELAKDSPSLTSLKCESHVRRQTTNTVLCIRPVAFRMNEQTAVNNYYQKGDVRVSSENVNSIAQAEFDSLVAMLREECTVDVIVVDDTVTPDTPDSIFPNNWISFHDVDEQDHDHVGSSGFAILYPMFAENRRQERRLDILDLLKSRHMFALSRVLDLSPCEQDGKFLEGTGSVIFDRAQRKAYCALSPRSDRDLILELCDKINYKAVIFEAFQSVISSNSDANSSEPVSVRKHIYHTNVMMCIAENFAVICLASIDSAVDRRAVIDSLTTDGKFILEITEDQVNCFAGNMLEVKGRNNKRYLVMSKTAYASLRADQIAVITAHGCEIKYTDIHIIETLGGGSARCMICEVFLPLSSK